MSDVLPLALRKVSTFASRAIRVWGLVTYAAVDAIPDLVHAVVEATAVSGVRFGPPASSSDRAGSSLQLESEASGEDCAEHGIVLAEQGAAGGQFVSVNRDTRLIVVGLARVLST